MTVGTPEESQGQTGHPAWQEILDGLPDEFHSTLTPKLQAWDQGVQQKLQDVRSQYEGLDPYRDIVRDQDPQFLQGALQLAQAVQQDPNAVAQQLIEAFGLEYAPKGAGPSEPEYDLGDDDIANHPMVKAMQQQLDEFNNKFQSREQVEQQTQAEQEHEQYMAELKEEHGDFDPLFVTALIAQGIDGDEAVRRYNEVVTNGVARMSGATPPATPAGTPPVVMGGDGVTGSGMPEQPVGFGTMSKGNVENLVIQMLNAQKDQ